ncbi:type II toxin-antitoxin system Phd/YefM family antitoxin [Christiangramia sp.]|uniref:type II toxin-antitoxin system Phd/YefM family antitoxin n=1 Tax=Christiangramia sp. TaxID=1931228 RepID=UPI00260366F1|nr:type II toxin-antitoxin system Phd/YefM family antitoxin [Christiangramia sp.]
METVNYSNFRSNLKYWFDKVIDNVSELIIRRKGDRDLVLISLDEYNSLKEITYLLTGKNREVLLNSINELESGSVVQNELIEK